MEKPVKVGVVGCGGIAHHHVKFYRDIPGVEVVAVADIVEARAGDAAKRWGVAEKQVFTSYVDMLEKAGLDAVSICTPHAAHAGPSIDALQRGVHVLVEKPMAPKAADALEMLRASRKSGKVLMVGFQTRFSPEIQIARRLVQEERLLGDFYYGEATLGGRRRGIPPESFTVKSIAGGGVILDIGCYAVDNAFHVLGHPEPTAVSAATFAALGRSPEAAVQGGWGWKTERFEVEDFAAAFLRLRDGSVMVFKESWAMHADSLGSAFFLGSKGGLRLSPLEAYRDLGKAMVKITPEVPSGVDPWRLKMLAFVEAVRKNGPSPIDPAEIVLEQYVLDGIYESAERKTEVKIKVPGEVLKGAS